jgi:hypothetical protein
MYMHVFEHKIFLRKRGAIVLGCVFVCVTACVRFTANLSHELRVQCVRWCAVACVLFGPSQFEQSQQRFAIARSAV